jgi:xanthine dehydrogenase accessory factor
MNLDLLGHAAGWRAAGKRGAIARVVDVEGSGPLGPGAAMAIAEDGEVVGSVSGGCVEAAVVAEAEALLRGERSPGLLVYGIGDDDAFEVGLTCGGTIHLFLDVLDGGAAPTFAALQDELLERRPVALATLVAVGDGAGGAATTRIGAALLVGPGRVIAGTLGHPELDRSVAADAVAALDAGRTGTRHYGPTGGFAAAEPVETALRVFVEAFAPPPQMWVFGAVDFTGALASVAKVLGYRVTVCDARGLFATARRFPLADEIVVSWPEPLFAARGAELSARDTVCILTHDARFDVPAIVGALSTRVGYIGVMGSRRTHARRLARLEAAGVTGRADLDRLCSPIGLDLGGRTPEETAVSICAEIIARRHGRSAAPLSVGAGPIHGAELPR